MGSSTFMRSGRRWGILAILFAASSYADTITFTHTGIGSGVIGTTSFSNAAFTITDGGDTTNVEAIGGGFSLEDAFASIEISGVGTFDFTSATRTFVSGDIVGFSRGTTMGSDLFDGPNSAAFATWDMLTSIGPISGSGQLLQWSMSAVDTTGGVLVFDNSDTDTVFTATVGTAVPEPAETIPFGVAVVIIAILAKRLKTSY